MAYTTPSTLIDLISDATDPSYRNVRYFATLQDQFDYFTAKTVSTHSSLTYQNYSTGKLRLQVSAATVKDCNYIRIRNVSYENKAYYAFLMSYELISDNCVEIQFKIDYFQTYFFDYNTPSCYIERTHTYTDNVGDNIEKEPMNVELKTTKGTGQNYYYLNNNIVMVSTPSQWGTQTMRILNNQIMVVNVDLFDLSVPSSRDLFVSVIQSLTDQGTLDRILFMKSIPDWAYSTTNPFVNYLPSRDVTKSVDATVFVSAHTDYGVGDYIPRNYKLYTSQFTKVRIMDSNGNTLDLKPECFNTPGANTEIQVTETCNLIGDVVVMVKLKNYSENPRENRLYIGGFPDIILTKDRWNEYVNQNGANVGLGLIRSALSANSFSSLANVALSPLATMADIKRQPSSVLGSPGVSFPVANEELGWAVYRLQVPAEEAQRIDEYFDIYGYAVNTIGLPTRKVRDKFTYIKTKELRVNGNMPEDAISAISSAYNNGVTFWADNVNFMNYSLAIREANSLHNS